MKRFMLDIETMGTNPQIHDVLQIGIVEVYEVGDYFMPARAFCRTLHTSQKPDSKWIEDNHRELLKVCNRTPVVSNNKVRKEILGFFETCEVDYSVPLMGLNLMSFDIPFLNEKKFLLPGDYHYRVFDLRPVIELGKKLLNLDEKTLLAKATDAFPEIEPQGKPHEALYDCYTQLRTLNGIIRLIRATQSQAV